MPEQPNPSDLVIFRCPICKKQFRVRRSKAAAKSCAACLRELKADERKSLKERERKAVAATGRMELQQQLDQQLAAVDARATMHLMKACAAWSPDPITASKEMEDDENTIVPSYGGMVRVGKLCQIFAFINYVVAILLLLVTVGSVLARHNTAPIQAFGMALASAVSALICHGISEMLRAFRDIAQNSFRLR